MSSGSFLSVNVLCPFYKKDEAMKRIVCEGIIDRSSVALLFVLHKDFEFHINTYCCNHYDKCEVYRMIYESKYDD